MGKWRKDLHTIRPDSDTDIGAREENENVTGTKLVILGHPVPRGRTIVPYAPCNQIDVTTSFVITNQL